MVRWIRSDETLSSAPSAAATVCWGLRVLLPIVDFEVTHPARVVTPPNLYNDLSFAWGNVAGWTTSQGFGHTRTPRSSS